MKVKEYKGFKHFGERDPKRPIKYLIVHSFALPVKKMISVCNELGVGPHYIIDIKGNVMRLVSEDKVAWHAGKSYWYGEESLNGASIGIELQNMTLGQTKYPDVQINAFIKLAKDIMKRHHIRPENVMGHSDVAPMRKVDPGMAFPWKDVATKGIGVWGNEVNTGLTRAKTATLLKKIGYDITDEKAALLAFMRHFMPERVKKDKQILKMEENLPKKISRIPAPDKDVLVRLNSISKVYKQKRKDNKIKRK